jgi:UDP-N-acetylmuramoyl-L-alanyl-D-glutamate--2,6-diaminopimelate ligase
MNKIFKDNFSNNITNWNLPVDNVIWKLQDSNSTSILFLDLHESKKIDTVLNGLKSTNYQYIVTNLVNFPIDEFKNVIIVNVSEWKAIQKEIMDLYYPLHSEKVFVGITGTNGKTTTVDLCLQMANQLGKKAISIGTLGVRKNNKTLIDFSLTTPNYIDFRKYLHMFQGDFDYCFMEMSSHSLDQQRIHSILLQCAGWTNLTQDHLDYHKDMNSYYESKLKIFNYVNGDSVFISDKILFEKINKTKLCHLVNIEINSDLPLFFKSSYNLSNLKLALSLCKNIGFQIENIDFKNLVPPPGRFNIQQFKNNYIVIDFAHTPDAIENICQSLRDNFKGYTLSIVFGCGGDRDRSKRPLMGAVAEKYCHKIYVTSDNPRSEEPMQIINDILVGIKNKSICVVNSNRAEIIENAIKSLNNEVLLIAGKGHENYIEINGIKNPYSDQVEVNKSIGVT